MIFFIARKLLLLSGLNVKDWASETFFSVDGTSIRISLWISICYFWFLKTLLTHLFSSSRHSLFITVVQILWAKQNSMFFKQDFRWFESNGTHLFESVSLKWIFIQFLLPYLFKRVSRKGELLSLISIVICMKEFTEFKISSNY